MSGQARHFYAFGPFRLYPAECLLQRDGQSLSLTPKAFDLLLLLVENSGHLVEKEELMKRLWPDTFVEEANLSNNISLLRRALGEGDDGQHYIETVPRRGYRFVAPVSYESDKSEEEGQSPPPADSLTNPSRRKLSRAALAIAALLIASAGVFAYWLFGGRAGPAEVRPAVKHIAVLPFKSLNSDGRDEYLGLGMADTLITKLSGLRSLIVRPTSAVRKYAGPTQDPLAAGHEQRVDAVLDASLQRDGERIRVTARLLNVKDGSSLWTYQCDEQYCANIFVMQDAISEKIASALVKQLSGAERQLLRKHYTEDREAHEYYLKGYFFLHRTRAGGRKKEALEQFEQAIKKDPNYALAYAGLADCYIGSRTLPPVEAIARARVAVEKALEIDDSLAEAHASLGHIKHSFDWDWAGAEKEYKRAIDLNPNYAPTYSWYAAYLYAFGRTDEAIAMMKRAQELDLVSPRFLKVMGDIFYCARQYDRALEHYRKTLEFYPNDPPAHSSIGMTYTHQGRYEEAIAMLQKGVALAEGSEHSLVNIGYYYAKVGKRDEAQKALDRLNEMSKRGYVNPHTLASIYAGLGDKERALELLEKAYNERASSMVLLKVDPMLDSLRAEPRFQDLLRRVGLLN
jgi:DNA-binding winged helix-turn-helix (wHTH) protein/TolB-like protein/Flp pilus assembly protein TadD